jgi:ABC-2 type transport system ATP-binding protein
VTAPPVIEVRGLSRAYGEVVALNDVSFDVAPGVVGLLGPNGAGKSTLLKIMTGELRPSIGEVRVLGLTPYANPDLYHRIGICPEQDALFDDLTGREFLAFFLRLRGVDPGESRRLAQSWLERFGLGDAMNRRIGGYSKGMRQRAKLALAIAHESELLFLDEPLTGLDPLWRHRVQVALREAAARGTTVIFSSHVLYEVEAATRQVLLLNRGRLAAQGDAREIRALIDKYPHRVILHAERPRELAVGLMSWDSVESARVRDDGVDVTTPRPDQFYARLTREAAERDLGVTGFTSPDDSIQALFETLVR